VVASRAVGERIARGGLLVLAAFATVTGLQLSAASGAQGPSNLARQADELRAENSSLRARERATWLSLVSLETRLEQSRAALGRLTARVEQVERERAEADLRLRIARRALRISQQRLASRLRALYEHGETDPLAVVLGSTSLSEAIEGIESLNHTAGQDKEYVREAQRARTKLISLTRTLAAREAEARRAQEAAAATAAALEHAQREQAAALAQLRSLQNANVVRASSLDEQARRLAAAVPSRSSLPATPPVSGGKTLSVVATGYALPGTTATGVPVGWGVVAVDPSVIPLGTRMTIPGYGEGVAADTGGAVVGAHIDLWFPTRAEALAWGSRTVTITLH
jgi:3D (Asp-Asp-Asp) domain-containing protein/peptidoglycan hydrolase CwlO-like protein